jgi:D-sedoheptulose 7-phosphate isomerase
MKIQNYFEAHNEVHKMINCEDFDFCLDLIAKTVKNGCKVMTCGNGGSAYTASHFITDWNKMVNTYTGKKFKGISLCDNVGLLTAFANDMSYEEVFSGQIKSIGESGDLLIAISGSGNSINVINAVEYANSVDITTLAIVGYDGGGLKKVANYNLHVPSFDMQICEDIHLMFGHFVMKNLCGLEVNNNRINKY